MKYLRYRHRNYITGTPEERRERRLLRSFWQSPASVLLDENGGLNLEGAKRIEKNHF